jgi:hypothetical protein
MKNLLNYDDLMCTLFYVENPDTLQPEIIVRFSNFVDKSDALSFVQTFKKKEEFFDLSEKYTIH